MSVRIIIIIITIIRVISLILFSKMTYSDG